MDAIDYVNVPLAVLTILLFYKLISQDIKELRWEIRKLREVIEKWLQKM